MNRDKFEIMKRDIRFLSKSQSEELIKQINLHIRKTNKRDSIFKGQTVKIEESSAAFLKGREVEVVDVKYPTAKVRLNGNIISINIEETKFYKKDNK